jgi:hypothetical protein
VGDHHDDRDVLLPDHAPEEFRAVAHGPLRGDEGPWPPKPVHVVGVEVLLLLLLTENIVTLSVEMTVSPDYIFQKFIWLNRPRLGHVKLNFKMSQHNFPFIFAILWWTFKVLQLPTLNKNQFSFF